MGWCLSSVHLCICSARKECDYYSQTFGWSPSKVAFVPFHTDPALLDRSVEDEGYGAIAAGRTFRDYVTLLDAFQGLDCPLVIVASPANLGANRIPPHVSVAFDLSLDELVARIAGSAIVVVPLIYSQISIGQSVILEAMAMGKAVIATEVNGTVDYIRHMENGLLVPVGDARAIREAVQLLIKDTMLRRRLGAAGRASIVARHLPQHYAAGVAKALGGIRL